MISFLLCILCIDHFLACPHLPLALWASLKPLFLKSLSSKSDIWVFSCMFSVDLFFSFEWITLSCFFVCLVIFFVANLTFESYVITLEITFSLSSRVCSSFNFWSMSVQGWAYGESSSFTGPFWACFFFLGTYSTSLNFLYTWLFLNI